MRKWRVVSQVASVACSLVLVGCAGNSGSSHSVRVVEASSQQAAKPAPASIEHLQIMKVIRLLDAADEAMKAKRLTTPVGDNAWGYYRDVLNIMPTNDEAHQGLSTIVSRYLGWAQTAREKGDYASAKLYLDRAQQVLPRDSRIVAARQQLDTAPRPATARTTGPAAAQIAGKNAISSPSGSPKSILRSKDGVYRLDASSLKSRSPEMQAQLAQIADEIYAQNAKVQILAPNDQLGRWIYLQLNNRHEDFRVRANMKISQDPRIQLIN